MKAKFGAALAASAIYLVSISGFLAVLFLVSRTTLGA
jgi:hypothetical protein